MENRLERVDASKNMFRYYAFDIQRDLFDQWSLFRRWGRIGTQGRCRIESYPTRELADRARELWRARKEARGYRDHE